MNRHILTFFSLLLLAKQSAFAGEQPIDFNRDIRPILSNACFRCHGPDPDERKGGSKESGGLRLNVRDDALADLGGYAAIVPGQHSASAQMKAALRSCLPASASSTFRMARLKSLSGPAQRAE